MSGLRDWLARLHVQSVQQPVLDMSFFDRLVAVTESRRARLLAIPQVRDSVAGRISLTTYRYYLAEVYHRVRHTGALMQAAHANLLPRQAWLKQFLLRSIAAERGHEQWILEDIARAGGDAEAVRCGTPRFATELLVAYAHHYVARVNAAGLLGMVFVFESTSEELATRAARSLMLRLGLNSGCFHYLLSRPGADELRSRRDLLCRIEDPEDQKAVIHVALAMYALSAGVFAGIPHPTEDIALP